LYCNLGGIFRISSDLLLPGKTIDNILILDAPILTSEWFDYSDIIPAYVTVIAMAGGT
jgi:hypothetical protein